MTRKNRKTSNKMTTREIGDILENIVAEMHEVPGVSVEKKVRLSAKDGSKRKREIDVLITSQTAGIPIRIAIECKNENEKTSAEKIDAFIGKLQDVNLPPQLAIYVSKSGYASGALSRAKEAGIKTLVFNDIAEKLSNTAIEAFQSIIYLVPSITNIAVVNNIGSATPIPVSEILFFKDKKGKVCGSIPDLVWKQWIFGKAPVELGKHKINVKPPSNWRQIIQGKVAKIKSIVVEIEITGFGISFPGAVKQYNLVDAIDQSVHKSQINAEFTPPIGKTSVIQLNTEQAVDDFRREKGQIHILNRIKAPRIRWLSMYWPPSKSTILKLNLLLATAIKRGDAFDLNAFSLNQIEGDDLSKLWEPIVADHPMLKQITSHFQSK